MKVTRIFGFGLIIKFDTQQQISIGLNNSSFFSTNPNDFLVNVPNFDISEFIRDLVKLKLIRFWICHLISFRQRPTAFGLISVEILR